MTKQLLFIVVLIFLSPHTYGGEIRGRITDGEGAPLFKVDVCLSYLILPSECIKKRSTNQNGLYSFKGINVNKAIDSRGRYIIRVIESLTVTSRQNDLYRNYVWTPETTEVELQSKSGSVKNVDFTGRFNFSNFQKVLRLTSTDFPELVNFDVDQDYVFLKLYTIDRSDGQNLIYIGQVTSMENLVLEVSMPLSATELHYEIFSSTNSVSNTIPLSTL